MDSEPVRKRRWGDRKDGYLVRDLDGLHVMIPHLMPNRTDSEVYADVEVDVTKLMEFLKERNANESDDNRTKFFHCALMAVAKMTYHRPLMNRFVCGRRTYEHKDITLGFIARKQFVDGSKESLVVAKAEKDWTLRDITDDVTKFVSDARLSEASGSDALDKYAKMPRSILMIAWKLARFLNFFGGVPNSLTEGDTDFVSVLVTNLGSVGGPAVYHHLNNYGTNSVVIAIGTITERMDTDGTIRSYVKIGATIDERIGDGFYFIRSLKYVQRLFDEPELLDRPLEEAIDYD